MARRAEWKRSMVGGAALLSASLSPATADAEATSAGGGGVFFGYRFGSRTGFEWGFEAFAMRIIEDQSECENDPRYGLGPLVQFSLTGVSDPRLTFALQGGGELSRGATALTGELGFSYRPAGEGGFGLHLGVVPEFVFFNSALRYEVLLNDAWLGGGARVLPTYGVPGFCSVGRPLRTAMGLAQVGPARACAAGGVELASDAVPDVGRAFAGDAQLEYASVPAFLILARELSLSGAPAGLIKAALSAAGDELRHARLCAALASRHCGQPVAPVLPDVPPREHPDGLHGLRRLALESWLDGCLAEGIAAGIASGAAARATDPQARATQATIAGDERRHAELAWEVLAWTLAVGGDDVRHALCGARDATLPVLDSSAAPRDLVAHGRLGADEVNPIAEGVFAAARARLEHLLWTDAGG